METNNAVHEQKQMGSASLPTGIQAPKLSFQNPNAFSQESMTTDEMDVVQTPHDHGANKGHSSKESGPDDGSMYDVSDWRKVFDQNSQRTYYWNCKTNETSWEMPTAQMKASSKPKSNQQKLKRTHSQPKSLLTKRSFSSRKRRENIVT